MKVHPEPQLENAVTVKELLDHHRIRDPPPATLANWNKHTDKTFYIGLGAKNVLIGFTQIGIGVMYRISNLIGYFWQLLKESDLDKLLTESDQRKKNVETAKKKKNPAKYRMG